MLPSWLKWESSAKFLKANIVNIPTHSEFGFKLSKKIFTGVFERVNNPWLCISGPTINPTGLVYSNGEMKTYYLSVLNLGQ